jgi:DNA-directed RNA polymerase subunit RPC12/RpoP
MSHDEESDEELDDRELPDERDVDEDDDAPAVVACPYCGRDMIEEAVICPHCRSFISREDAPPERRPLLIVIIVLLLVGVLSGLIWLIW